MNSLKMIIALGVFAVSSMAMAQECLDAQGNNIENKPEVFQKMIAESKSCYAAAELARACAWGSSMDVYTAGAASNVCGAQLDKLQPKKADSNLLKAMIARCNAHHDDQGGTMALATTAHCHLSAIEFVVNLLSTSEVY